MDNSQNNEEIASDRAPALTNAGEIGEIVE